MNDVPEYDIIVDGETFTFYEFVRGELQCPNIAVPRFDTPECYESWFCWLKEELAQLIYPCETKMMFSPYNCSWSIWGKKIKDGDKEGRQ